MGAHRILVVDDDPAILRVLRRGLTLEGFSVEAAGTGHAALEIADQVDAIVLDVSMPRMSGIEVCAELRRRGSEVPILMLSALDEVADRVAGLSAGADDYMVKPFDLTELALRLRALLRRSGATSAGAAGSAVRVGDLVLDTAGRDVVIGGRSLTLTRREFDLLEVLARNAGIVLSREVLLERVWGYDFAVTHNAVETFIGYLRRKLEAAGEPRILETVRGVGYVLRGRPS
ncbi:response regulator transcription factor [Acrocarpospora macrocephala]|uniref:Putative transcriptional regulatory protein PrrA n=1 Tax=Acrocarpospora macrocephala TaxID=150177 RepID=A0A5M3WIH5_9ACTN|nr:response regulator transcription factor [Acrocarpospora macrocephala]GES08955.1 putative transcriptional regulatory protein PrrA [Acrocarpospora macrocephala]